MRSRLKYLPPMLLFAGLLVTLPSCSWRSTQNSPEGITEKPLRVTLIAEKHIETGEYQKAIDAYLQEARDRSDNQALRAAFAKNLETIKRTADGASSKKHYSAAGITYDILVKNYPRYRELAGKLSFDEAKLNAKLSTCREALSARGFQEYRNGNLSEAIKVWESLLVFDPGNEDIKGALKTARLQQKNLKERSSGQ